jgi:hypothetical protein
MRITDMTYDFSYPPVNDEQRAASETNRLYARGIFERCITHLLAQGRRSMVQLASDHASRKKEACAYRGDDGLMCAVGCLIADEFYDAASMESKSFDANSVRHALRKSGVELDIRWYVGPYCYSMRSLLEKLQRLHDTVGPADWRGAANYVADRSGLTEEQAVRNATDNSLSST